MATTDRYIKKTVILAKVETVAGVDAAPTGAANAIKAFDLSIEPVDVKQITIPYIAAYFGAEETIAGAVFSKCSFSVSLSGSGDAATSPRWFALMQACASAELTGLTAPARTELLPATDDIKTVTIYWYDDGLLHKLLGCVSNVQLSAKGGTAGSLKFDMVGMHTAGVVTPNVTGVLTAWKPPVPIRPANVTDINLGCTYAAGALTGGTPFQSTGLTLDWGIKTYTDDESLTADDVGISDRKIKGSFSLRLSAAEEAAKHEEIKAGTLQSMGFVIGTVPGNKIMLYAPAQRLLKSKKEEKNGQRWIGFDFELNPVLGNDELRVISL